MIDLTLRPTTGAGREFLALAEHHAEEVAATAAIRDQTAEFPRPVFEAMRASGFLAATVPKEFGGLGLSSVHDLGVGLERLGRADASTAIAANMHLGFGLIGQLLLRQARSGGGATLEERIGALMKGLGEGAIAMANFTEPGTDLLHPFSEGRRVEGGWSITGRKTFSTLAEIADLFFVSIRVVDGEEVYMRSAIVPRGTHGQQIHQNWDALGMRASGSHDVIYDECVVPESYLLPGQAPWGEDSELTLIIGTVGQFGLVPVFLGIAEQAAKLAREVARERLHGPGPDPGSLTHSVGEMEVELATCRALVDHTGHILDEQLIAYPAKRSQGQLRQLASAFQCAKLAVNRCSIMIVDQALSIVGGRAYLNSHPLSRLYRDVRAGPFMQPYSPIYAYPYIGRVALDAGREGGESDRGR
jgi:alkylation response protein AidB-like acyl-CoA dehydrogenase